MDTSAAPKLESVERRRHGRFVEEYDVDVVVLSGVKTGDQFTGRIINISREGAGIIMPPEIQGGDRLLFTIYVDDDNSMCDGKVMWKREVKGRVVYGVKILHWTYMEAGLDRSLPKS